MKYRKKPVVIEAVQYDGDLMNRDGKYYVPDWVVEAFKKGIIYYGNDNIINQEVCELYIDILEGTHEGTHHVSVNDYIIKGINNELYCCKPDIFEKNYELVKE